MIEAVENHMPEVIVIDEIGTEAEAFAARTIAERGVQLIATAHGNTLENLLMNPTLSDLVGGIQAVTLSDEEAKRRGTQKTVLERKAPPTFDVLIEIMEMDKLAIHHDVASIVDKMLRGVPPRPEIRVRNPEGEVEVVQAERYRRARRDARRASSSTSTRWSSTGPMPAIVKVFPYGVSRNRLERAIRELRVPAYITKDLGEANAVDHAQDSRDARTSPMLQDARRRGPAALCDQEQHLRADRRSDPRHIPPRAVERGRRRRSRTPRRRSRGCMETGEPQELTPQTSFLQKASAPACGEVRPDLREHRHRAVSQSENLQTMTPKCGFFRTIEGHRRRGQEHTCSKLWRSISRSQGRRGRADARARRHEHRRLDSTACSFPAARRCPIARNCCCLRLHGRSMSMK